VTWCQKWVSIAYKQGCKRDLFFRDRDETETFEILFETRPRQSKSSLEAVSRPRRRDRDFIPAYKGEPVLTVQSQDTALRSHRVSVAEIVAQFCTTCIVKRRRWITYGKHLGEKPASVAMKHCNAKIRVFRVLFVADSFIKFNAVGF